MGSRETLEYIVSWLVEHPDDVRVEEEDSGRTVIYDLFLRLQAERGIAFLIATHNPDLARKAERGYRLVEGRARGLGAE